MIEHRPFTALGGGDHGWLKAHHHFHIGDVGNPAHTPLGDLVVWNDDEMLPGTGFPLHGHANLEIITYVRKGYVAHRDSLGNEGRTKAGDVQVMSAGTGIAHAETASPQESTKVFQIWIRPRQLGGSPRWGTKPFPKRDRAGRFVVLASGFAEDVDALPIRADARVAGATLKAGQSLDYPLQRGRKAYLVASDGAVRVNGLALRTGDGAALMDLPQLRVEAISDAEVVLVDVA